MTRLLSTAVAFPKGEVTQTAMAEAISRWLTGREADLPKILRILQRSGVERRQLVVPLEELFRQDEFGTRNRVYIEHAVELAAEVARAALREAAVASESIDLVTTASCTGFMIPSLDAHLANVLPFRRGIRRLPITELGCAGGAMALTYTADILRGQPDAVALVVAVEISSVNAQPDDMNMANLVSCALFGDGAAAVLLAGEESELARSHPRAPRLVRYVEDSVTPENTLLVATMS